MSKMAKRDSLTVWLPKEMYGSVEPFADDRYIWSPMPFDESLPVEQTSFIDMGSNAAGSAPPPPAVLAGPADPAASDTDSEGEFPLRKISQNLSRGRRRPCGTQPARQKRSGAGDGCRNSRGFAVHLGLNLDIEVTLKARILGGLEISALRPERNERRRHIRVWTTGRKHSGVAWFHRTAHWEWWMKPPRADRRHSVVALG
ncbi:hypothetical protein LX36DRAFT_704851 [Colletotrichum falcatum]|nr:hypothetical protein LX36DRAFT_704851 [Colletotrichum falcatum]